VVFVEEKKLEKNMIFYIPGQRGAVFTYKAGNLINDEILSHTMESLAYDMDVEGVIKHVEDRRIKAREMV
jgi:hypothetical protein